MAQSTPRERPGPMMERIPTEVTPVVSDPRRISTGWSINPEDHPDRITTVRQRQMTEHRPI